MSEQITVILGAEGELGKALAREVARKKCNLVLVSTTSIDLQRFAIQLQLSEDVLVDAVKLDLADTEAIRDFSRQLKERYEVRALINNITCDWSSVHNKCISQIAREDFLTRFRGAALITWSLLPQLSGQPSAFIQHIIPFPFRKEEFNADMQHSVSKMYAFAKELKAELKNTPVSVSMVHPAPIHHWMRQYNETEGLAGEGDRVLSPAAVAVKAVNGMLRGDRLIIPGFWNRMHFFLSRQATAWFRSAGEGFETGLQPSV